MKKNIWLHIGTLLCILSTGVLRTFDQSLIIVGRKSNNQGQLQTLSLPSDGVLRRDYTNDLTFTPLALATDPAGKWIAISSKLTGSRSSISILRRQHGAVTQAHQHNITQGPVIFLAYHPSGKWLVASTPTALSIFRQNNNGTLTPIPQQANLNFDSKTLVYNSFGTILGTLSNLGTTLNVFSQNNGTLQSIGSISLTDPTERFKAVCFTAQDNVVVAKEKMLPGGSKVTFLDCYTIQSGQLSVSPVSSRFIGTITSLSAHPTEHMFVALLLEKESEVRIPSLLLFGGNKNNCSLQEIGRYSLAEFKEKTPNITIKYDDWGEWVGVGMANGDFVLFKQQKDSLDRVNTYSVDLNQIRFDFLPTKKKVIIQEVQERLPVKELAELVEEFTP